MIRVIDGDLFTTNARFIVHQVNCKGVMGSGVAKQVRNKYPHVFVEYKKVCSEDMLGKIQVVPCNPKILHLCKDNHCVSISIPYPQQFIINVFAQGSYGYDGKQYTDLDALEKCFKSIRTLTHERNNNNGATIAMPWKIGCCRGGADWDTVYTMIDEIFSNNQVELWRLDNG